MSNPIFPPEIIENTIESYHTQIKTSSKVIYGIIILLLTTFIVALMIIKVDITSQCRGLIRSPHENTTIQSALYGEIVHYKMHENKLVKAGDTLLVLNADKLTEQSTLTFKKNAENKRFISDLGYLVSHQYSLVTTPKYLSELHKFQSKINELQVTVDYLSKDLKTTQLLSDKKVVSEFEYLQAKNNYDKATEQLNSTKQEYIAMWQAERTNLQLQNQELASNIKQIQDDKKQYVILSPATGVLTQVAGFQKGNFIAPSQTLAYISANDSLLAECYISPADIGYIRRNQKVNFQFDAYNYREWGMLNGSILQILHDVVIIDDQPRFRVRCKLNKNSLELKNGYKGQIQKGLTFTARFYLTRRTLWELLFDKLDSWLNPKIVKTENQ